MWERLQTWLRGSTDGPVVEHAAPPDPETITLRVLVISHNPIIERAGGRRLSEVLGWHDPAQLAAQYQRDVGEASGGFVRYEIAEMLEPDAWPRKIDGFRYDDESFLQAWRSGRGFHSPDAIDYPDLIAQFQLTQRVMRGEIDEVWFFGPPYAGHYESTMVGQGAFWCNSPPVDQTQQCQRRFVMMGFNYERDVGCMLENFGHRAESIMEAVYRRYGTGRNQWAHFCRYDAIAPGQASCGNVHFAPSSTADYDWGNPRTVLSDCDDWLSYPQRSGTRRPINAQEWGGGDMRLHHLWWLGHLPRAVGSHDGVLNNWWRYILDPNLVQA